MLAKGQAVMPYKGHGLIEITWLICGDFCGNGQKSPFLFEN